MKKEVFKHRAAYMALVLGLGLFIMLFLGLWPNRMAQRMSVLGLAAFYFIWGVVTHVKTETISSRVVAEYAGVSLLAGMLLIFITM